MSESFPIPFNLEEVDRNDESEMVAPDTYLLEVAKAQYKAAIDGKKPLLILGLRVIDSMDAKNEVYRGANFVEFIQVTFEMRWRMAQFLDALYGRKVTGNNITPTDYLAKRFVGQVSINEWEGKKSSRVDRFINVSKWRKGASTIKDSTGFDFPKVDAPKTETPTPPKELTADDDVSI
jgi:hypothetical protein